MNSPRTSNPADPGAPSLEGATDTGGTTILGSCVSLRACPSGPLLVRGAASVLDAEGVEHDVTRPVVAVCLCRKSSRGPWCDGTHKAIPDY